MLECQVQQGEEGAVRSRTKPGLHVKDRVGAVGLDSNWPNVSCQDSLLSREQIGPEPHCDGAGPGLPQPRPSGAPCTLRCSLNTVACSLCRPGPLGGWQQAKLRGLSLDRLHLGWVLGVQCVGVPGAQPREPGPRRPAGLGLQTASARAVSQALPPLLPLGSPASVLKPRP